MTITDYLKDFAITIILSVIIIFIGQELHSVFFDKLIDSILGLLCAIFAINITSTALIAELINKVSGQTNYTFEKTKIVLIQGLKIQGLLIIISLLLIVIYHSKISQEDMLYNYSGRIVHFSKVSLLSVFSIFYG